MTKIVRRFKLYYVYYYIHLLRSILLPYAEFEFKMGFYFFLFFFFLFSTSRQLRNEAERIRRYKLNKCITQLSQLVPFISNSPKKMEKTAVLRLSAAYLRLSQSEYTDRCFFLVYYRMLSFFSITGPRRTTTRTTQTIEKY